MKIGSSFVISVSWEDYDDEIGGIVTLRRRSDRDYEGKRFFGHQSFGSNWFFWIGKALGVFEEGFPRLMVMELGRLDRLVNQRYQGSYKEGVVLAIIQTLLNYCSSLIWQGLGSTDRVDGAIYLRMGSAIYRSLQKRCKVMKWDGIGCETVRSILSRNMLIRGQEDRMSSMIVNFNCWGFRNGDEYSIGCVFFQVEFTDGELVWVMDVQRDFSQD
ncbi:unnamed protein product, partial [Brassica rapa subsp. trilocularis]